MKPSTYLETAFPDVDLPDGLGFSQADAPEIPDDVHSLEEFLREFEDRYENLQGTDFSVLDDEA